MTNDIQANEGAESIRLLVQSLARIQLEEIPPAVLGRAVWCIADCIAVGLTTANEPEIQKFRDYVQSRSCHEESTIFSSPAFRKNCEWAAAANALAMTTSEMDGGYDLTPCHAALYTIPALLANAEAAGISVCSMLRAEILAYELITRIARAWSPVDRKFPALYTHSRFCAIAAAAATAFVLNHPTDTILRTVNISATLMSVGPRNHLMKGALVRNVWPSAATLSGLMSAQWAVCGFDGLQSSVYDVFSGVLGFPFDPQCLTENLGDDWAIAHSYVRVHACHLFFNTFIECLMDIHGQLTVRQSIGDIDSVFVRIHPEALGLINKEPKNSLQARFSIPHIAAAVLSYGNAFPDSFSTDSLNKTEIAALRTKVQVVPFDMTTANCHKWPAAVDVSVKGESISSQHITARGGHGEPYGDDELMHKIKVITTRAYPNFARMVEGLAVLDPVLLGSATSDIIRRAVGGG